LMVGRGSLWAPVVGQNGPSSYFQWFLCPLCGPFWRVLGYILILFVGVFFEVSFRSVLGSLLGRFWDQIWRFWKHFLIVWEFFGSSFAAFGADVFKASFAPVWDAFGFLLVLFWCVISPGSPAGPQFFSSGGRIEVLLGCQG
jgi:hypothetical protein